MQAILSVEAGGPETLVFETLDTPKPKRGEVLIGVRAAGVNFPDSLLIRDLYQIKPTRPFSPGAEVAGVIEAVGDGVDPQLVGSRVVSLQYFGAFATHLVCSVERAVHIPDEMNFVDAAALLLNYGTAHYALVDRGNLKPGETLFVPGAAGGVGSAAVQLGKALGAQVIAGVSSNERAAFARESGADHTLIYPRSPLDETAKKTLTRSLRELTGGRGIDVCCDAVGGDYADPLLRGCGWESRYLVVGFTAGIPTVSLNLALLRNAHIIGVFWGASIDREPQNLQKTVQALSQFYLLGRIRPRVTATYPLSQAAEAMRSLEQRNAMGKVVLTIGDA